ncbi:MAG: MATE family efflux transporter, partial [Clostridia bacterium]
MTNDLTVGKPSRVLLKLSLPMFISVIFQQMYNLADSIIAGQFAGENALAAVGASYPITMIFMAIAVGLNIGCSVVISQLFGSKQLEKTKTAISTTLIFAFALSAVLTVVGIFVSAPIMQAVNTPSDIFVDGVKYLQIYAAGFVFLFLYNATTAVFTALGDTRTPLMFLIVSSVLNIVLDYVFVAVCHWGVSGVAWATFIAQGLACVCSLTTLLINLKKIKTEKYKKFSFSMLGKISKIAFPSILQQSFISVGNILIQIVINGFGASVVAGFSAVIKLNAFAIMCIMNMANGLSTFTAQNIGAGKLERIKKAYFVDMIYMFIIILPFVFLFCFGGEFMMKLFVMNISQEALDTGMLMLKIISPFYLICAFKLLSDAVLRGSGAMLMFMISTFTDLILRVVISFVWSEQIGMLAVCWSWPIGWVAGTVISVIFYASGKWKKNAKKFDL